jgi:hypothetical protein
MHQKTVSNDYSAITAFSPICSPCEKPSIFINASYNDKFFSPIDQYINNCIQINKIWVSKSSVEPALGRILLLGYISAVESYFRAIFRLMTNIDPRIQTTIQLFVVSYAAAMSHTKDMLVEALLESYSFSGQGDVRKAFEKFLGIGQGRLDKDIDTLLHEYERICQLRHCCAHRFGKLGSSNGLSLGLKWHKMGLGLQARQSSIWKDLQNFFYHP